MPRLRTGHAVRNRALTMKPLAVALVMIGCQSSPSSTLTDGGTTSNTLGADTEAVTLDGIQVPNLLHVMPSAVAAFRWTDTGFVEVPVQIDPREVRPFSDAMSPDDPRRGLATAVTTSFYTDSNAAPGDGTTFVGADSDPSFDADDELVVLARDFGGVAPAIRAPDGVNAASRTELHASIGASAGRDGYLYLFTRSGAPTAFPPQVTMTAAFSSSGDFKTFYRSNATDQTGTARGCGGGPWGVVYPESTTIIATAYQRHFAGRWISDELRVRGTTDHPDLLDIGEVRPAYSLLSGDVGATKASALPSSSHACDRSTTSFSGGPGTIITLRQGPLRAIRSVYGANSGTITERTNLFYPAKEDIYTFLRVHPISGASDGFDLSPEAEGMTYFNEHNQQGLAIDGVPDVYDRTFASWELVTGATQGSVLSIHRAVLVELGAESTTTYAPQTMFLDNGAAPSCVCSGDDDKFLGAHGPQVFSVGHSLPNTDPLRGDAGQLVLWRAVYPSEGLTSPQAAAEHASDVRALVVSVDGGTAFDPYAVTCGDGVCEVNETSANCPADCPAVPGANRCGDHTCVDGEQFLCRADCPPSAHADYYACLDASCNTDYFSCASDPGCSAALTCLEVCTDPYSSCVQSCGAAVTDQGSRDLATAVISCGATPCASTF